MKFRIKKTSIKVIEDNKPKMSVMYEVEERWLLWWIIPRELYVSLYGYKVYERFDTEDEARIAVDAICKSRSFSKTETTIVEV